MCTCTLAHIHTLAPCLPYLQVASAEVDASGVKLSLQPAKGEGAGETLTADVVLVSTGGCCAGGVAVLRYPMLCMLC